MARNRHKKLPFETAAEAHEFLQLSDRYPSGLEWNCDDGWRARGEMCGKWNAKGKYYVVRLKGSQYHAHRIVYFLRTGVDPIGLDIKHENQNVKKDNRLKLLRAATRINKNQSNTKFDAA